MAIKCDVTIIGGGITGVATARDLSMRGLSVTLVEKNGLSYGTTGRSHGLLHSGARYANSDKLGAKECIDENRIIKNIAGDCIENTGGLFVKLKSDDQEYFEQKVKSCKEIGIPVDVITGDEARKIEPSLSMDVEKAIKVPDAAIYPSRIVSATAESSKMHGANIYINSPVKDINVNNGRVQSVTVGGELDDTIKSDYVVNTTGAWAEECAKLAGVELNMKPTKGVMVSVNYPELNTVINRTRITNDGDIIIPHKEEVVLGTTSIEVDEPENYPKEDWEVDLMFEECSDMIPDIEDLEIERTYWGVRPLYAPEESERDDNNNQGENRSISRGFQLLDHSNDGVDGFCSVVGGKLTTHRLMAEEASDLVCDRLNIDSECMTDENKLPFVDSEQKIDDLVKKYEAGSPADSDVIGK